MEIPENAIESILEQIRQLQIGLRSVRDELGRWRKEPIEPTAPTEAEIESFEPPTEKQILFLKGLGIEEIPPSKEEARQLLQELNEKMETGDYVIPPTEKQLKFLKNLKYAGPIPESKEAAWKLIRELNPQQ